MICYHPTCIAEEGYRFSLEQEGEKVLIVDRFVELANLIHSSDFCYIAE